MKAAKVNKTGKNEFEVIDTRDGKIVARNLTGQKAWAYVEMYDQDIKKAEAEWVKIDVGV